MAWTCTYNEPEPQRINRWLGQSGVCSRREAEAFILQGLVSIDGEVVTDAGRKIEPGQTLTLASDAEGALSAQLSIIFHKPIGIVSAQPEADQIPAARLLTREALWEKDGSGDDPIIPDVDASLPALGRLDKDSRGLLILSQDGVLAKAIIGPDSVLTKQYEVTVEGEITTQAEPPAPRPRPRWPSTAPSQGHAHRRTTAPLRAQRRPQPPDPPHV